jgi:hypothetical protein
MKLRAIILGLGLVMACGGGSKPPAMTSDTTADKNEPNLEGDGGLESLGDGGAAAGGDDKASGDGASGTEDSAKALLKQFVDPKADHAALSTSLRPTTADYKALFDDATAPKMEAAYAKEWDSGKMIIKPKSEKQSEIKLWGATGAELAAGTGNANQFPGGYKKVAKHLSQTVMFYAFKFVEPKKEAGMAYDGLAFVNGHWVITPKPYHIEGGGGGEDKARKGGKHPKKK